MGLPTWYSEGQSSRVGFNHDFEFNKEGDYKQLWSMREKYNFEAEEIPEQEVHHKTVNSTKMREAIKDGYIQKANAYLDLIILLWGKDPFHYENPNFPVVTR